jgi:hypothetical protein
MSKRLKILKNHLKFPLIYKYIVHLVVGDEESGHYCSINLLFAFVIS